MTTFLFMTSFVGLLALVPIRKVFHFSSELYDVSCDTSHLIQLVVQMLLFSMFCCLVIYCISDDFIFMDFCYAWLEWCCWWSLYCLTNYDNRLQINISKWNTIIVVLINGFHTPKGDVRAKYKHVLFCPFLLCVFSS